MILHRHTLQVHKPLFYFQSTHLTEEPYFTLTGVSYERVIVPDKASKKPAEKHSQSGPEPAIEP